VGRRGRDTEGVATCCVITTAANELVKPFHDRMPAILSPEDYAARLDADTPLKQAHAMLKPHPAALMEVGEASTLVNSPKNEGPRLLGPAARVRRTSAPLSRRSVART
jgi:putative SOS response-associated peptidase YedK